jgi:hypothetical protein
VGLAVIVPVVVVVPTVVVPSLAVVAIPIACKELLSVMARSHPVGALIRRPGPVSLVPTVAASIGEPVAV